MTHGGSPFLRDDLKCAELAAARVSLDVGATIAGPNCTTPPRSSVARPRSYVARP